MSGKSVLGGLTAFQWKKSTLTNILVSSLVPSGAEQQPRALRSGIRRPWAISKLVPGSAASHALQGECSAIT